MSVNKVVYDGDTLIDLTGDTVTAADILYGKKAHDKSGASITGSMTNRGAVSATINPGGSYTIPAGYHNGSGTVTANNASLQTKTQTVTPSANWSGTNTNNATISPDSGYAGMSQVNVNVPMLRDGTLVNVDSTETPSTVYNGNTAQSNSTKCLRVQPSKDGMSYTNSYLYIKPNSYLGNASASDVASGKTFSSSNGIQITGTGSSGTDTSDATLDSGSRMLSGYTAYAKGTKYTGSITQRSASSETISSAKTYQAGYYPSSWTVTPQSSSVSKTLLWSNPSPSSNFDAQTITLSDSFKNYDAIKIMWRRSASLSGEYEVTTTELKYFTYQGGYLPVIGGYTPQGTLLAPYLRIINDGAPYTGNNKLYFSVAYRVGYSASIITDNSYIIPVYIYGLKNYQN